METIQMSQKPAVMNNWWLAASSQQRTHSCITSRAEFFGKTSNHPSDSVPLRPRFGALRLLAFSKTKTTFEREEISVYGHTTLKAPDLVWKGRDFRPVESWWDSGKYNTAADGYWENCVRSQGAYFKGDWSITVLCTMFLVSSIFFTKCLYFSYYIAGYFLDRPCISYNPAISSQSI